MVGRWWFPFGMAYFRGKVENIIKKNSHTELNLIQQQWETARCTLSPITMEVEDHPKWKEINVGGAPFPLPWLWEKGYGSTFQSCHGCKWQNATIPCRRVRRDMELGQLERPKQKQSPKLQECGVFNQFPLFEKDGKQKRPLRNLQAKKAIKFVTTSKLWQSWLICFFRFLIWKAHVFLEENSWPSSSCYNEFCFFFIRFSISEVIFWSFLHEKKPLHPPPKLYTPYLWANTHHSNHSQLASGDLSQKHEDRSCVNGGPTFLFTHFRLCWSSPKPKPIPTRMEAIFLFLSYLNSQTYP